MVSDHRGDLRVREIAFSAEAEEVKALTSSYLHNERGKEILALSTWVFGKTFCLSHTSYLTPNTYFTLSSYSDTLEWPKQKGTKNDVKEHLTRRIPRELHGHNMKIRHESQINVHALHDIFTSKLYNSRIRKIYNIYISSFRSREEEKTEK